MFLPGLKRGKVLICGRAKGTFCARSIILRALLSMILHFEGTFILSGILLVEGTIGKITYLLS